MIAEQLQNKPLKPPIAEVVYDLTHVSLGNMLREMKSRGFRVTATYDETLIPK